MSCTRLKMVIGDFNAKIGKEGFINFHAGFNSLHNETSGNGQRLFDFAVSENMFIANTRKYTNTLGHLPIV